MAFRRALQALAVSAAASAFSLVNVPAQTAVPDIPTYEVASIRLNANPNPAWRMEFTPDGVSAHDVTLEYALQEAFGVYDPRLFSGGPAWISQKHFDIEAKFDVAQYPHPTLEQRRAMLQQLLADRFKLLVHHEGRQFAIYALVISKHGPKFAETKPADLNQSPTYGVMCNVLRSRRGALQMSGCTMEHLASSLGGLAATDLGRKVIDKTGLTSRYDLSLHWTPLVTIDPPGASTNTIDFGGPSVFTAVKEQLGLELKPITGPLDTIVIDHIEMPSEN